MDDTFLCINKHELDIVVDVFNDYYSHIKFTHEIENENKINSLDVTVHNINYCIITYWYQKDIASDSILMFTSNHTTQQKRNMVYNLVDRAFLLSDVRFQTINCERRI